jgi:hypothetical protein
VIALNEYFRRKEFLIGTFCRKAFCQTEKLGKERGVIWIYDVLMSHYPPPTDFLLKLGKRARVRDGIAPDVSLTTAHTAVYTAIAVTSFHFDSLPHLIWAQDHSVILLVQGPFRYFYLCGGYMK